MKLTIQKNLNDKDMIEFWSTELCDNGITRYKTLWTVAHSDMLFDLGREVLEELNCGVAVTLDINVCKEDLEAIQKGQDNGV